jgi:hypothetical protein
MKKILNIFSVAAILLFAVSCKKSENSNPLSDVANFGKGAYITLASNINLNLNYAQVATSKVGVKVSQYNNGNDVDKIKVYVVQGANANPTSWKLVKTVTYAGEGTELSATGAEIATALGVAPAALTPGNFYTFYNQVLTKSGETYDISNINSALESGSFYGVCFRWTASVVCPFVAPMAGTYRVVQDDWVDWSPGDLVQVTDGPGANQLNLSKVWPNPSYGNVGPNPLVITVDASTGNVTLPAGLIWATGYPGTASTGAASSGLVFSCTGRISLSVRILYNGGDQGFNKLILQKQ